MLFTRKVYGVGAGFTPAFKSKNKFLLIEFERGRQARAYMSATAGATITFSHDGRVVDAHEGHCGSHASFYANHRAFARNAVGFRKHPQLPRSIVNLVDAAAQETDGLRHVAGNGDFLVHEASGIGCDVPDLRA